MAKVAVQTLVVSGLAGNNTIVCATDNPAVINAGDGNDTIQVQSKNALIDGGRGADNLVGAAALDYDLASERDKPWVQESTGTEIDTFEAMPDGAANPNFGKIYVVVSRYYPPDILGVTASLGETRLRT